MFFTSHHEGEKTWWFYSKDCKIRWFRERELLKEIAERILKAEEALNASTQLNQSKDPMPP